MFLVVIIVSFVIIVIIIAIIIIVLIFLIVLVVLISAIISSIVVYGFNNRNVDPKKLCESLQHSFPKNSHMKMETAH